MTKMLLVIFNSFSQDEFLGQIIYLTALNKIICQRRATIL